jgi:hypothetical protein
MSQRGKMKFVLVSEAGAGLMQFFRIEEATLPQVLLLVYEALSY